MNRTDTLASGMDRLQGRALVVGIAASALFAVGAFYNPEPERFLHSYLLAFVFWIGLPMGSLALLMLHHMVGGGWGLILRRLLEAAARTLPLMALLSLPLMFGLTHLYEWARPEAVAADHLLQHKSLYLNQVFFRGRTAFYFALWLLLAYFLNKWSLEQDRTGDPAALRRMKALSGPGLLLYGFTITFAAVDWVMSLEPHWFSTAYGLLFMIGQALSGMAFVTVASMLLAGREPLSRVITRQRLNDIGNLLMAFVMLWAYIAFSQFLIIWSGNLPEEITWYRQRFEQGWVLVALFLVVFHFAIPFVILLSRRVKRRVRTLGMVAIALLLVHMVDLYWVILPAQENSGLSVHWMDAAAPVGMGGIWLAFFIRQLKSRPLLPANDPLLLEVSHG